MVLPSYAFRSSFTCWGGSAFVQCSAVPGTCPCDTSSDAAHPLPSVALFKSTGTIGTTRKPANAAAPAHLHHHHHPFCCCWRCFVPCTPSQVENADVAAFSLKLTAATCAHLHQPPVAGAGAALHLILTRWMMLTWQPFASSCCRSCRDWCRQQRQRSRRMWMGCASCVSGRCR